MNDPEARLDVLHGELVDAVTRAARARQAAALTAQFETMRREMSAHTQL